MLRDNPQTQTVPFHETDKEFAMLLIELRHTPREDLRRNLVIATEPRSMFAGHGAPP
jgi:hypothetical protein